MPSVISPSSYSTLASHGHKRPIHNVEELRARQRTDLFSHRRAMAQDRIINRRKSLNAMYFSDDDTESERSQSPDDHCESSYASRELHSRLHHVQIAILNNPQLASGILVDNWRTIIDGLGSPEQQLVLASMQLLAHVDMDESCVKTLIKYGLLYQLEKLFRPNNEQWQTLSLELLNHIIMKVPESITFIVDIMNIHKMFREFDEMLQTGSSVIVALILRFYDISINALASRRNLASTCTTYLDSKQSFEETILKLFSPETLTNLLKACFNKSNRSQAHLLYYGLSIFSGLLSTVNHVYHPEWFKWHSNILEELKHKHERFVSSVDRRIRRTNRHGVPLDIATSQLKETCTGFSNLIAQTDTQLVMLIRTNLN